MNEQIHSLTITPVAPMHWEWSCVCGKTGQGPTEFACEFSFERHTLWAEFQRGRGRL